MTTPNSTDWYGPQTRQVKDLLERLRTASPEQLQMIYGAYDAEVGGAAYAGYDSATSAACEGTDDAAADAYAAAAVYAVRAAYAASRGVAGAIAGPAAYRAAFGLATRHLVGTCGYTMEHYETLVGPVAQVLGPLHPGDESRAPTTDGASTTFMVQPAGCRTRRRSLKPGEEVIVLDDHPDRWTVTAFYPETGLVHLRSTHPDDYRVIAVPASSVRREDGLPEYWDWDNSRGYVPRQWVGTLECGSTVWHVDAPEVPGTIIDVRKGQSTCEYQVYWGPGQWVLWHKEEDLRKID